MTFFSLNSIIYSEFHSVFLDTNTTKLEGKSSFHPASPCNLPPGKTVLRNECSSHNGLKRQPPFQMLQGHGPTCLFFSCFAGWSHQKGNWRRTGFILRLLSELFEHLEDLWIFRICGACKKPWMTSDDLGPFLRHGAKWKWRTFKLSG